MTPSPATSSLDACAARLASGPRRGQFSRRILAQALLDAFRKLDPRVQARNLAMLAVLAGAVIALIESIRRPGIFTWSVAGWLTLTMLSANFAEAVAEGRGKAQADALRRIRSAAQARRLRPGGGEELISAAALGSGDLVVCEAGDVIPSDGEIVDGMASIDESAITGESAPVIRESGGDHSAVTGGTTVLSDRVVVRITAERGHTFLDRMIGLVEDASRQRTPSEIALMILLAALTIAFVPVVVTLLPYSAFARGTVPVVMLVALLVCLMPTTIGGLLPAIGIAGMDRLLRHNVLAMSRRAVEAAGGVQTLLIDKTGTITLGNRVASAFHPVDGHTEFEVASAAQLASLSDETSEGRSIVVLAKQRFGIRQQVLGGRHVFIPFSAQTRMSGLDVAGRKIRKGAAEAVRRWVSEQGGAPSAELDRVADRVARSGATPLAVAEGPALLGVIELKDTVKQGIRERLAELRAIGVRTVMITGDNPLTAAAIAQEAGIDGYLAEATPEAKLNLIKAEQAAGKRVAMIGDGANDAPALAQADVGVAMNAGSPAARTAGNMVDLDSNPAKLIDIVKTGKQLLITRGALTVFSIASAAATYLAIVPAMFAATYPHLRALNVMHLHSPQSAVLSALSVVAGFLVYDFFFVPPYLTLRVGRSQNWAALGVYAAVMLPVARVVAGLNTARAKERRQGKELRELFGLSGLLLEDRPLDELLTAVVTIVADVFGARQVALLLPRDGKLDIAASAGEPLRPEQVRRVLPSPGEVARLRALPDVRGDVAVHALTAAGRPIGLLVLSADSAAGAESEPLTLFANQIALAVERAQLREQALRTRLTEEMARLARTLVAAVSHDLRTPLARIKASSSTLADGELELGPEAQRSLATLIDAQADRLADLVQNLLDMSRIQVGVLRPRRVSTSLPELAADVTGDLEPAMHGHQLRLEVPGSLPPVDVDRTLIARVLTNLLENAIRYAPRGTPITVTAALRPPDGVLVSVADRGPGMSPERRDQVFGMLARRDADVGAGLGLAIAKTFVEAHGQRIWVEDAPGGGARFCFTLPVTASSAQPVLTEERQHAAGAHR